MVRRLPLGVVLASLSGGLALLVLLAILPATLGSLEEMVTEAARARVELAAIGAREAVLREQQLAATAAHLLAERPTLGRLLAERETSAAELVAFVERFRVTGDLFLVAVVGPDGPVVVSPANLPWSVVEPAGVRWIDDLGVVAVASTPIATTEGLAAVVARRLEGGRRAAIAQQVGLPTTFTTVPSPAASVGRGSREVGDGVWIEVHLEPELIEAPMRRARQQIVFAVVVAALAAIAVGVWGGRYVAAPLHRLRRAAEKIGSGDLRTAVEPADGLEAGALARAMEDMRRRVGLLAADLTRREAEAQALLSGTVEGVFAVGIDRKIEYLNPQAAAILGVEVEQALGRFCGDMLWRSARERRPCESHCPIVHARSRGSSRAVETLDLPSGRRTVVITSAPPAGGRQVQVMRDETEIEAARRSRDIVLANVSHELKTPLAAQLASLELLRDGIDALDAEAKRALVGSLERSTRRLALLIDNLLESVRIETGQTTLRRGPVDLGSVAEEATVSLAPLLAQRGQGLRLTVQEDLPTVLGDTTELGQVLVNLLANAHKYAPESSSIEVDVATRAGWVIVTVDDEGSGVASSASSSIFDRYRRGVVDARGLGLGLWIAKSIVVRHGGTIEAGSSPAGGARFTVSIPVGGGA